MKPPLRSVGAVQGERYKSAPKMKRALAILLLACTAACTGPSRTPASSQRIGVPQPAEQRVSAHVYALKSAAPDNLGFLIQRAAQLTIAAGYGYFAVAQVVATRGTLQLLIFMYNDEREIPLELIEAETFDASEYDDKPYAPLGLYPGIS